MDVTEKTAIDHGLKKEEYKKICEMLKRVPNFTELGIFQQCGIKHCSYKSSRKHLETYAQRRKSVRMEKMLESLI